MNRIEYIDFAKGYAIFTIVCYHALQRLELSALLQKAIVFGGTGVHLFFLLSGFGLALSSKPSPSGRGGVGLFYKRRLVKVWLPYVLALTISLLAAIIFGLFPDRFDAWLAGAGLYQMFSERHIESFGGHFWFISAIIQFYLAFPFLLWLKKNLKNDWFFSLSALAVSVAWWLTVYFLGKGDARVWNSFFLQFLWEFALGMVLGDGARRTVRGTRHFWNHAWWIYLPIALIFSGIMILMILKMGDAGRVFNDIPALIGYAAFSVFFFQIGDKFLPLLKRFFLWVGSFSYSLYLVHILVLEIYLRLLHLMGVSANWLSLLPFLALALLAGRAFEPLSVWWTGIFERKKI
ncbi:MAG: acyltransferase [Saprospiraceae bacterium]|nr:acyltransferase [Saprospiraceae bacterium]